jgi:putative ABC transport system ATP-binding protein/macrolide transport system ATP-binding/permease protein/lipoprotein-releasing system ATP-binding protein
MLRASKLAKVYDGPPRRVEAVKGVDLEVPRGQFLAVTGRSGSGKSTLLGMIGGLSRPTEGAVTLDGVDLWSLSDDELADFRSRKVGFVFQFSSLLPNLRAVDNVALPALIGGARDAAATYSRAEYLLARVGLGEQFGAYPGELSGGEQRRVAIARALINSPSLLLADEPTGDLDEDTEAEILDLLLDLQRAEDVTLVVVTHNLALAQRAQRVVQVRQGRIAAAEVNAQARDKPTPIRRRFSFPEDKSPEDKPRAPAAPAPTPSQLGEGLRTFLVRFVAWAALTALLVLGVNQALRLYQHDRIEQKQQARQELQALATGGLRADIEDLSPGPDGSYRLTLYLWNVSGGQPIYVMAPTVRAYVQVGSIWQEVPLRPADAQDGQVLQITGRHKYHYVLTPAVKQFEELLPGYMHVRFTNALLVSRQSEPTEDLVERLDNYYVYLKPHDADDAAILRKMKFPGKPPVWIPMPPH